MLLNTNDEQAPTSKEEFKMFIVFGIITGICIAFIISDVFLYSLLKAQNVSAIYITVIDIVGGLILCYPSMKSKDIHMLGSFLLHLTTTVGVFVVKPLEDKIEENNLTNSLIFKIIGVSLYFFAMAMFLFIHKQTMMIIRPNHNLEGNCSICLDVYENKECVKTKCNHFFHFDCLKSWIDLRNDCPLCPLCRSLLL